MKAEPEAMLRSVRDVAGTCSERVCVEEDGKRTKSVAVSGVAEVGVVDAGVGSRVDWGWVSHVS